MDSFPVPAEVMQAFPLGALSLLLSIASTVAARHGVENARRMCAELVSNDQLWLYIAERLDNVGDSPRARSGVPDPQQSTRDAQVPQANGAPSIHDEGRPFISESGPSSIEVHASNEVPDAEHALQQRVMPEPPALDKGRSTRRSRTRRKANDE
jgi:hypothetical protein